MFFGWLDEPLCLRCKQVVSSGSHSPRHAPLNSQRHVDTLLTKRMVFRRIRLSKVALEQSNYAECGALGRDWQGSP